MSDESPLLDFLLADLAWGKKPRAGTSSDVEHFCAPDAVAPTSADLPDASAGCAPETADEAFAREIELAREVCEDAEVDALTQPVPTVTLPFGKSD